LATTNTRVAVLARLKAARGQESYSDVILRLAKG
jgi:predicted CopG family antitoxin